MYSKLKGNVSTHPLNSDHIAGLVSSKVLPPQPRVLSALIGITYVAPKGTKLPGLPRQLHVRRRRVHEALLWLKHNNPLYKNIIISDILLEQLPIDGVPEELLSTVRVSHDMVGLAKEQDGYVLNQDPTDDIGNGSLSITKQVEVYDRSKVNDPGMIPLTEDTEPDRYTEPDVFFLHANGMIDANGDNITDIDVMRHALANLADSQDGGPIRPEDRYFIRRGSAFTNEYARIDKETGQHTDGGLWNPNHLLGSFLWLFPYALGGFEVDRPIDVPYEVHARWALQYADKRFRKDYYFVFQVYGMMHKCSICRSASLQIKRSGFIRSRAAIATLTPEVLHKAGKEET
ncbi:uncharacterized protein EV420DRAFT_1657238 [Desarmillaria tabescens]|uniref:DUF6570 domain-containing protein n=1 Tax=Armillaria tabescens TaxID=1929756 RepID=A0AA39IXA1_ARMTA|nr:uncharacterized protein EV420DRAFT_1657238 [Desarmillaria tabescens]KAK0430854.1 hypothetical protein EV420DRAFT_1657238 [Desarmillaria tabescens]